jgi:hypothetical protein
VGPKTSLDVVGKIKISRPCRDSIPCLPAPNLVAIPTTLFPDPVKINRFEKLGRNPERFVKFSVCLGHRVNSENRNILAFTLILIT